MKKIAMIALSVVLMISYSTAMQAQCSYARTFSGGERLYVNLYAVYGWVEDNSGNDGNGQYNFAYFFNHNSSATAWSQHAVFYSKPAADTAYYYFEVPAGTWDAVVLTQNSVTSGPDWSNVRYYGSDQRRTGDLCMQSGNFITHFEVGNTYTNTWESRVLAPSGAPASQTGVTKKTDHICTSAAGDLYVLTSETDQITNVGWFHYNTSTSAWDKMAPEDPLVPYYCRWIIPTTSTDDWFMLVCEPYNKRKLINVIRDVDCQQTCQVTAFKHVISAVNTHDSTYAIDGIIAFGDTTGTLTISCDGKDSTYSHLRSPLVFSLQGLKADNAAHTLTATFSSSVACNTSTTVTAPSPSRAPVYHPITIFTGDTIALHPDSRDSSLTYLWKDGFLGHDRLVKQTVDTLVHYVFTDFNIAPTLPTNLIANGNYETLPPSMAAAPKISDYTFWGVGDTLTNFYASHKNATGGYAIVKNAHDFYATYATVKAYEGQYFALFDGDPDPTGKKRAWYVATTSTAPNLQVQKGVTYMFSFRVANINNFGEMGNPAELQFVLRNEATGIEYNLGSSIDMADYHDNLWHQCSSIYTATADMTNISIMVLDANTSTEITGNDFGLDDIQFQAISMNTPAVQAYEQFDVTWTPAVKTMQAPTTICTDVTTTLTSSAVAIATSYLWNGGNTKKDSVYSHHIAPDYENYPEPDYLDTLICLSYRPMGVLVQVDTFPIVVQACRPCQEGLVMRKWNDILFVNNATDSIASYQWVADGKKIDGATGQYLQTDGNDVVNYACIITKLDGTILRTCNHTFTGVSRSADQQNTTGRMANKFISGSHLYLEHDGIIYDAAGNRLR